MPLYDFQCERGHVVEERQGIDVESVPCRRLGCRSLARRRGVYKRQFMQAATGPISGRKNEVPVAEKRIGKDLSEYTEAVGEVGYAYEKAGKKAFDPLPIAKARANRMKRNARP